MTDVPTTNSYYGTAALGICESLLLTLADLKVISDDDLRGLLTDVATSNNEAAKTAHQPEMRRAVAEIVGRILAGKDGLQRAE